MTAPVRMIETVRPHSVGLTQHVAAERLRDGANEVPTPGPEPFWRRLAAQFAEPMSLLLLAAAGVSWLGLGKRTDAGAIAAIVLVNAVVALVQQGRAQRALASLKALEAPFTTVVRDGAPRRVPAREVVPGDVLVLASGDRVPADARLLGATSFEVDESILTGESLPVAKAPGAAGEVLAGTMVTGGGATALVTATGPASRLGRIATSLDRAEQRTPLQDALRHMSARLALVAAGIAGVVFVVSAFRLRGEDGGIEVAFLSAAALAVAAVPEGLPTVVTVALALGVRRMAARGAIVRSLPAVETLGSTSVVLTDKTGTLTENRMRVDSFTPLRGESGSLDEAPAGVRRAAEEVLALCNDATPDPPVGDPTELALVEAVGSDRTQALRVARPRRWTVAFSAERRRMTTVHGGGARLIALMKGSPEEVLSRCSTAVAPDGTTSALTADDRRGALAVAARLAGEGQRVLALARRAEVPPGEDVDAVESDLTWLGLIGLRDPVRAEAAATVRRAAAAGIRVVMVTGDHPGTAHAVAVETGIADERSEVVLGADMESLTPDDLRAAPVFARVAPEQKLALVRAYQVFGEVVAVTGDGVNDAPALRSADIGVAMGRTGSDVAREAADMVVTDDDLATVITAVEQGRGIYRNLEKVVAYLVGGNLSEVIVVVVGLALFPDLGIPLLPMQLLWINLLTDGLSALALGVDPVDRSLLTRSPRPRNQKLLDRGVVAALGLPAALIAASTVGSLAVARFVLGETWSEARAVSFSTLMTARLLYAYVVRRPASQPNRWLDLAVAAGLALQVLVVTTPALQPVFGTAPLGWIEWLLVVVAGVLPAAAMVMRRPVSRA